MLHNGNLVAQERGVHRPFASIGTVDIVRVNANQNSTGIAQPLCQHTGEVRKPFKVRIGTPVPVPTGVDQYRLAADIDRREW
jgi:hypothetical protein